MKILVTGGAGFIGSAVVRQAMRDGHQVVNLDALTTMQWRGTMYEVQGVPLMHSVRGRPHHQEVLLSRRE